MTRYCACSNDILFSVVLPLRRVASAWPHSRVQRPFKINGSDARFGLRTASRVGRRAFDTSMGRRGGLPWPRTCQQSQRVNKAPSQVLLAWALQRGTAVLTTPKSADQAAE